MPNETTRITCVEENCGTFPMDEALVQKLKRTGDPFTCPAGHKQHFTESPEQQLHDRISRLEDRNDHLEDRIDDTWGMLNREREQRRRLESALLERVDGVVEIADDDWMWACECGGRARSHFDSEADARSAYQRHQRQSCSRTSASGGGTEA